MARPSAMSRSRRRMIFPERVFGRSAVKRISSGRAMAPIFFATWALSSSARASEPSMPSFRVTNAAIDSPFTSWCFPTTAASATRLSSTRALSTSMVPMRWPAVFSTSSTRPRIQMNSFSSSSRWAPSPGKYVFSHLDQ